MPIRGLPNGPPSHPSTGWSRSPGMGGRDQSERLVAINRNRWSRLIGIGGRDRPVRAAPGLASREINLVAARNRQTYWTSTSPSSPASRGPVQRANPAGGGLSSNFEIRLSVDFV